MDAAGSRFTGLSVLIFLPSTFHVAPFTRSLSISRHRPLVIRPPILQPVASSLAEGRSSTEWRTAECGRVANFTLIVLLNQWMSPNNFCEMCNQLSKDLIYSSHRIPFFSQPIYWKILYWLHRNKCCIIYKNKYLFNF